MIDENHIEILISILKDSCKEDKIVPRSVLFSKFESKTKSGMEIYKFKKALSFLIKNGTISGYDIKIGRNGGVFKISSSEQISITCSSGKFIGEISKKELNKLIKNLKNTKDK